MTGMTLEFEQKRTLFDGGGRLLGWRWRRWRRWLRNTKDKLELVGRTCKQGRDNFINKERSQPATLIALAHTHVKTFAARIPRQARFLHRMSTIKRSAPWRNRTEYKSSNSILPTPFLLKLKTHLS